MKGKLVVRLLSPAVDSYTGYVVSSFHPMPAVQSLNDPTCSFDADSYPLHHAESESKCQALKNGRVTSTSLENESLQNNNFACFV